MTLVMYGHPFEIDHSPFAIDRHPVGIAAVTLAMNGVAYKCGEMQSQGFTRTEALR